jgi:hypothetical protein
MSKAGTISCTDLRQFLNTIAGLVERGLRFEADADTLKITLTGGY